MLFLLLCFVVSTGDPQATDSFETRGIYTEDGEQKDEWSRTVGDPTEPVS